MTKQNKKSNQGDMFKQKMDEAWSQPSSKKLNLHATMDFEADFEWMENSYVGGQCGCRIYLAIDGERILICGADAATWEKAENRARQEFLNKSGCYWNGFVRGFRDARKHKGAWAV